MFKFHDVEQNTDEWMQMRAGRLTSSNLGKVMANYGKVFGEPAKRLAVTIAIQQITGQSFGSSYTNEHMERGHEQEPIARMLYEEETFSEVTNGGFFCSEFIGCSPDGLVGDKGVIEIKSVIAETHFKTVKRKGVDPAYKWQCIGNLKFTGRQWIDFVSYSLDFPIGKQLFIYRLEKGALSKEFEMIDVRVNEFMGLVKETKKTIENSDYDNYSSGG